MPLPDYYNADIEPAKVHLRQGGVDTRDAAVLEACKEAFEDMNIELRKMGVEADKLPFAFDDKDIKLIKSIEARGAAGFYSEDSWAETEEDTKSEMDEAQPTNPNLAIYYRRLKAFHAARFGPPGALGGGVSYVKASTQDLTQLPGSPDYEDEADY